MVIHLHGRGNSRGRACLCAWGVGLLDPSIAQAIRGAIMRSMIKRQVQALAAGICIAIIVQESTWIAFDALDPTQSLNHALAEAPLSDGWLLPLLLAWAVGGFFGGLMATLVGRSRLSGHATGLLLAASAALLAWISLPGAGGFLVIAATPVFGSTLGTWLGYRLGLVADRHRHAAPTSVVTLRCVFH